MATTYDSKYATGAAVDAALDKAESALQPDDVVNALDSTSTDAPLSAAQGKALEDGKLAKTELSNVLNQGQQIRHGFDGRTGSSLAWDPVSYEFVLLGTDQDIWLNGVRYNLTSEALTVPIGDAGPPAVPPADGTWYITVQDDGWGALELVAGQAVWAIDDVTSTPVATAFWNGTDFAIQDERHGAERNLGLHAYLHRTVGARIQNDGSFAQTRPTTANDGHLELTAGTLWDEDIANAVSTAQGKLVRNWYETASGVWTWADGTANSGYDRPYIWNGDTSLLQYPNTGSAYALTDCAANRYIPVWVYASNDIDRPIYIVTPALAVTYTTVANARAATAPVLPFAPELKLLYRWIYRGDGEYQEAADYRTASSLPSGGVSSPVAGAVSFSPSGDIAATNVQAAIEELDTEKLAKTGGTIAAPTLTGATETSALDITQTWNTTGNPSALKVNVTNTASGAAANLLDLQANGGNVFTVDKGGNTKLASLYIPAYLAPGISFYGYGFQNGYGSYIGARIFALANNTIIIEPLMIEQRAGSTPQEYRLYGSYTSDTAYQRLSTKTLREAVTAASGASVTTTITIPKYSHLIGVTTRVTTALGTSNDTTGYQVGDGTDPDLWGAITGTTEGTTSDAANFTAVDALGPDGSDRNITLTAVGGNFDGTGVITVCAYYLRAEAD